VNTSTKDEWEANVSCFELLQGQRILHAESLPSVCFGCMKPRGH
jgi:hypothetical protein